MKKKSSGKWRMVLFFVLLCGVVIQFIRPRLDNPAVSGDLQAPPEVKRILKRACYDCHSNETKLAWFDRLEPAYWLVAQDVREGRKVLNFSLWDSLTKDQQKGKLFEAFNKITFKEMPLKQYRLLHAGATITGDEQAVIRDYLSTLVVPVKYPDTTRSKAAGEQYEKWIRTGMAAREVAPAPNGIAFIPDYKDWVAISATERFDNGTLRAILANDQALKAIREGHVNPWPDGAAFAKIAWDQSADSAGIIRPGVFKQVEFMIKDSRKYADADGWGWARWVKGAQLAPYGKDALFVTECMNCHKPMQDRDFVFTSPLDLSAKSDRAGDGREGGDAHAKVRDIYNREASLRDSSVFNPLAWKVITSFVDKNHHTMSILYGNDIAVLAARLNPGPGYPAGSVLSLVTWSRKEDRNWYGGSIPAAIQSIEKVTCEPEMLSGSRFSNGGLAKGVFASYESYAGSPLKKTDGQDSVVILKRIADLVSRRASVLP